MLRRENPHLVSGRVDLDQQGLAVHVVQARHSGAAEGVDAAGERDIAD
jgi:hypothetical protein